jgi:nucleoporin SEH1
VDIINLPPPAPMAGLGPDAPLVDSSHSLPGPNPLMSSSVASSNGFSIGSSSTTGDKQGLGKKEADGGWCLSWCKDKTYGELCAVTAGATGTVKVGI